MRFAPRVDSGDIYDITCAPPWRFLTMLPKQIDDPNPLAEDVKALAAITKAVFEYCENEQIDEETLE